MNKQELRRHVEELGLVPVIRTSSATDARFAVEEVAHAGVTIIEEKKTVPGALEVINELAKTDPRVIMGNSHRLEGRLRFRQDLSERDGWRR